MPSSRVLLACAASALVACNGATFTVGTDGATLDLPSGAALDIPPGALSEDVEITATLLDVDADGWTPIPAFGGTPRVALALEPHGLQFDAPVTLSFPHGGAADGLAVLRTDDESDPDWASAGVVSQDASTASVQITGFSGYALVEVRDGSCPCFDPADVVFFRDHGVSKAWAPTKVGTADRFYVYYWEPGGVNSAIMEGWTSLGYCQASAVGDQGGQPPPGTAEEWFPGLDVVGTPIGDGVHRSGLPPAEAAACTAMLQTIFDGTPGSPSP